MKKITLLLSIALSLSTVQAAFQSLDRIIAVVDEDVILESDLMETLYQMQSMPGFGSLSEVELKKKVLEKLVNDKVVLAKARMDTLSPTPRELEAKVNAHVEQLAQRQKTSVEELAKAVKAQMGISLKSFKEQLKGRFVDQLAQQKVRGRYIGMVSPTPQEVRAFYEVYKDSLPTEFNSYQLSHIERKVETSVVLKDSIRKKIDSVVVRLNEGTPFEQLAEMYSDDEDSKYDGGDLGFIKKGTLDPVYERVAFRLEQGQFTEKAILTDLGFHLIKVLAKKDNEIRTAQILFNLIPTKADTLALKAKMDSVLLLAKDEEFGKLASTYSQDKVTASLGGKMGWFSAGEINSAYRENIMAMKAGELTPVVLAGGSYHIVKLEGFKAERPLSLADDWDKIKSYSQSYLANEALEKLVVEWRKSVYVEIRVSELRPKDYKVPKKVTGTTAKPRLRSLKKSEPLKEKKMKGDSERDRRRF